MKGLAAFCRELQPGTRVLDVGCGNGYLAGYFSRRRCQVVGIDLSTAGIELARLTYPSVRFEVMPADDRILERLNEEPFDLIVSAEVVEHLYAPRDFAQGCFSALKPGGTFLCTTPYHGYLKNLLVCVSNKFDSHFNPLWDGGHIKFWSLSTLSRLLTEAGFRNIRFRGSGRVTFLWKSMVIAAERPLR
jgi:2-polyprenyl-3-methyl-5-hydroxy-6-metoxy-1,4-benzoquinol methylase